MENNNAPFFVGQKVICINPSGCLIKDKIYTVLDLFKCKCKCGWHVAFRADIREGFWSCCGCDFVPNNLNFLTAHYSRFAPAIQDYLDMRKEIADSMETTPETPDKILKPRIAL